MIKSRAFYFYKNQKHGLINEMTSFVVKDISRHPALNASIIPILDAFIAGKTPPTKPMTSEKRTAINTIFGVMLKEKASSEKVWKFKVDIE